MKTIVFWAEAASMNIKTNAFLLLKGVKVRSLWRDVSSA